MSTKYKIDIDPQIPSEEKIAETMNFSKLMEQASSLHRPLDLRKKMHKRVTLIMLAVSVVAIALALFFSK